MKNFTPFTERLPIQGRWILVTDDLDNIENGSLWLAKSWQQEGDKFYCFDNYFYIHNLTHWKYAIEEGG